MIDTFALALTHCLLILAAWRLLARPDLDDSVAPKSALPETPDRRAARKFGKR